MDSFFGPSKAGEQWSKFHLAAGYNIAGIGLARVGFLGADRNTHQNSWTGANAKGIPYSTGKAADANLAEKSMWSGFVFPTGNLIQLAFGLTAVENLTLDFGFGLPIAYKVGANQPEGEASNYFWSDHKGLSDSAGKVDPSFLRSKTGDDTEFQAPLNLSLATEYVFGDFGARLRGDLFFGGSVKVGDWDKQEIPVTFDLHLHPFYNIPNIGKAGLEFGFNAYGPVTLIKEFAGKEEDFDGGIQTLAFGGWFEKALVGGTFRVGLAYSVPLDPVESFVVQKDIKDKDEKRTPGIFTIPVNFSYSF
jgi:hypothetical protein